MGRRPSGPSNVRPGQAKGPDWGQRADDSGTVQLQCAARSPSTDGATTQVCPSAPVPADHAALLLPLQARLHVPRATPRRRERPPARRSRASAASSSISATSIWSIRSQPGHHTRRESAWEYMADPALCFMFSSLSYCILDSRTPGRSRVLLPRPHPPRGPPAPPSHHNGSSSTQDPANPRHPYPKPVTQPIETQSDDLLLGVCKKRGYRPSARLRDTDWPGSGEVNTE